MSEINAAFGLVQLKYIETAIQQRKVIDEFYRDSLKDIPGIKIYVHNKDANSNYSYFPVTVEDNFPLSRDELYEKLKEENILARRYFYPLISNMPMYRGLSSSSFDNLQFANNISDKVLCLPIFNELTLEQASKVVSIIRG
jgi:dTDP-4-amino-4,6-dideoxygalactose transaminase